MVNEFLFAGVYLAGCFFSGTVKGSLCKSLLIWAALTVLYIGAAGL